MKTVPVVTVGSVLGSALSAAVLLFPMAAAAQSNGGDGRYMRGAGSSSLGVQGVSISTSAGGGLNINIANVGASSTMLGRQGWSGGTFHGSGGAPGFGAFPGMAWAGGGFNPFGMMGFNVSVGGGASNAGGVTVNIANIGFQNSFFAGFGSPWAAPHGRHRWPVDTSSGNGDSGGGGGSNTGGEADSGGVGTGGY